VRTLVISPRALGDSIVSNPLLKTLRVHDREGELVLVGPRSLAPLLRLFPGPDRIVALDDALLSDESLWTSAAKVELPDELRAPFDVVVDLLCTPPCRALVERLEATQKVGIDFGPGPPPYTVLIPPFPPVEDRSAVELYLDYARGLGLRTLERSTAVDLAAIPPASSTGTREVLERLVGRRAVALLLGGGDWHKRYPPELVAELIRTCPYADACLIVMFGPSEQTDYRPWLSRWRAARLGGVEIVDGKLTDLAYLLQGCSGAIGNDCGFVHMAVALGVPTLALFGPAEAQTWFPYLEARSNGVMVSRADCRPCYGSGRQACQRNRCMEEFEPRSVWRKFDALAPGGPTREFLNR
jgi:ADP-heptose:LPS heptosyltransferase